MKVRINREEPTAAQRRALKAECVKEFDKQLADYNRISAVQILHILHFDYGFGQQRLKKFAEKFANMQLKTIDHYGMTDEDTPWLCEKQLREDGINIDEILR